MQKLPDHLRRSFGNDPVLNRYYYPPIIIIIPYYYPTVSILSPSQISRSESVSLLTVVLPEISSLLRLTGINGAAKREQPTSISYHTISIKIIRGLDIIRVKKFKPSAILWNKCLRNRVFRGYPLSTSNIR